MAIKANKVKLSAAQVQQFKIDGYLVLPSLLSKTALSELAERTLEHLEGRIEPFELEADVHYPGAPESSDAEGGKTLRRLLNAYQRSSVYAKIAIHPLISTGIRQILGCQRLFLNTNHHNCVMTKQPEYSSSTLWHRDTRYWNFSNKYLVNVWAALGDERKENGAMQIIPGSHRWEIKEDALDEEQFLRTDHEFNQQRLQTARMVELDAGDVLLFSAHCFHAAGRNTTQKPKFSLVFTYHGERTKPIDGTHSASSEEIELST